MGQAVSKIGNGRNAADGFQQAFFFQLLADKDRVDHPGGLEQRDHRLEDPPVTGRIEIVGLELLDDLRDKSVVEQNGTQDDTLAFLAARQRSFEKLLAFGF